MIDAQNIDIWKDKRAQIDLANYIDLKLVTGYNYESDLSFQFWLDKFPEMELNSPATARKFLGGDYSIDIRWFDTDLKEVEKPHSPGRYAYYAEITGENGTVLKRAATLFCTPNDWLGWSELIQANIAYFPIGEVGERAWTENNQAISEYAGSIILKSMLNNEQGGILLSFIYVYRLTS